jgi:hypothetical protein
MPLSGRTLVDLSVILVATGFLVCSLGAGDVLGQVDQLPPDSPPLVPPVGMMPGATVPAAIDTGLAIFEFPDPDSVPTAVHTVQDTVLFGDMFHLVLDYPGTVTEAPDVHLASGEGWLKWVPEENPGLLGRLPGRGKRPQPDMSDIPDEGDGFRVVRSFRIYRTDPFRLQAGDFVSSVIHVRGRIAGTDEMAGIRAPRPSGWSFLVVLGLLLFFILILVLARWLWNRGRRRAEPTDRVLPLPAWLTASIELRDLVQEGFLNRGDCRPFLDGLAGIARRFVAGRYRIAAQDMTGREITAACAELGHRSQRPGGFAGLIDVLDHRRYDPEASGAGWCREQAVQLYDQISRVRIMPGFTEVPADLLREGESAWAGLKRELSPGSNRRQDQSPVVPGQER